MYDTQTSKLVQEKNPAVAQAAKYVATTQIRHKGTMAGNICVDARITLGAVAITHVRAPSAERVLIGQELTDEVLAKADLAAKED